VTRVVKMEGDTKRFPESRNEDAILIFRRDFISHN
jgi:hypothetical protein